MKDFGLIIKLGIAIFFIMFFGDYVPEWIQKSFFTGSMVMKDSLVFFMPLIVFSFIFAVLAGFQKKAPILIVLILSFVIVSNFVFVQAGFFAADTFLPYLGYHASESVKIVTPSDNPLAPYFSIPYPHLLSTDLALLLGTIVGLYGAFWGNEKFANFGHALKHWVQAGLTKVFIPLVPLYVIGFLFKIQHDDSLIETFSGYGPMIGLIVAVQVLAVLLFYIKANLGNWQDIKTTLRNVLPSGIVGLSTMSSAATMPIALEAAEKNTKNKSIAQIVIPSATNIHHVGDSIAIPILIAVCLTMHGFPSMTYGVFLIFTMYYMVAKFGVPSVPGGELIILFPILEGHFGFSGTMIGLLTTLYILMDPFITATNVLSNGAFAIIMDKLCGRMKAFQAEEEPTLSKIN